MEFEEIERAAAFGLFRSFMVVSFSPSLRLSSLTCLG